MTIPFLPLARASPSLLSTHSPPCHLLPVSRRVARPPAQSVTRRRMERTRVNIPFSFRLITHYALFRHQKIECLLVSFPGSVHLVSSSALFVPLSPRHRLVRTEPSPSGEEGEGRGQDDEVKSRAWTVPSLHSTFLSVPFSALSPVPLLSLLVSAPRHRLVSFSRSETERYAKGTERERTRPVVWGRLAFSLGLFTLLMWCGRGVKSPRSEGDERPLPPLDLIIILLLPYVWLNISCY